jgi:hypothetical protein
MIIIHAFILQTAQTEDPVQHKGGKRKEKLTDEGLVLLQAGRKIDVSLMVTTKRKFRGRGGKDGAMAAMRTLQKDGLGKLVNKETSGTVPVCTFTLSCAPTIYFCGCRHTSFGRQICQWMRMERSS